MSEGITYKQDLPPQGGYAPIRYKRNLPVRGPSGVFLLFATVGVSVFGFWRLGQGNIERRYVPCTLMNSELARERAWSRIYLTPLLLAETDRDMFRRDRASALRENLLMKDVPNWEVGKSVYNSKRYTPNNYVVIVLHAERQDKVQESDQSYHGVGEDQADESVASPPPHDAPSADTRTNEPLLDSDAPTTEQADKDATSSPPEKVAPSDERLSAVYDREETLEEPAFHTSFLQASVQDILVTDSISSMAVSLHHVALGLQSGMIYVLSRTGHLEKGFRFHSAPVLDIVFDSTGEFVGSAGMDGLVAIASLTSSEQYEFDFHRPMRSIALEPQFGSRSSRAFVCGGMSGVLVYREKRWFGHKETVLHNGEGPIWTVAWHGRWIAWANDRGVRIMEATMHEMIALISAPPQTPRPELVRCTLHWRDSHTLLIAQKDRVTVASIRTRSKSTEEEVRAAIPTVPTFSGLVSSFALPAREQRDFVQVTDIFQLDCVVTGIAWSMDAMITLAYLMDEEELAALDSKTLQVHACHPPEIRSINSQGEELESYALDVPDYSKWHCNDYHLRASLEPKWDPVLEEDVPSPVFFVATPKRLLVLRPRDERDHIQWLLEHHEYREALEALEALGSGPAAALGFDMAAVGRSYLAHLIEDLHDYTMAAQLFPLLLRSDTASWEHFIFLMLAHDQVKTLLPHVPIKDPELDEVVYDMILVHLLRTDEQVLLTTLRTWPGHLYSTQAVAKAIEDQARNSRVFLECLAQLYRANQKPGQALLYLLRLRDPSVFDFIRDNDLLIDVQHRIGTLVELDQDVAGTQEPKDSALVPLLVKHMHSVPIQRAMHQFEPYPWYQYLYLDALFEKDPSLVVPYANQLVRLYSDFSYTKLMPFLRSMSSVYSFKEAYRVCEERGHVPEMVFLRGRTGDLPGALNLILDRLNDVEMAIEFVQQQDDADLWNILLAHSYNKPDYVRGLLEHAGGEMDPVRLIRPIEHGLVIPGLRPALIKTLTNFHLQHSLLSCGMTQFHVMDAPCAPIALFLCMHAAHLSCLQPPAAGPQGRAISRAEPITASTTRLYAQDREQKMGEEVPEDLVGPESDMVVQAPVAAQALTRLALPHQKALAKQGCPVCAKEKAYGLPD
ncbi:Vacuolar protein sorting-associated protein 41 [Malassezia nana]|uniref:Vacuolar protein sorting-associated protein 41 n=1 Tax=Malassezia nana TaxID=180528 RepID=A0AAF0J3E4_9BASI|nr:Vacuolar protein sorting-associated protein 41 [Malassezia nana]